MGLWRLKAIQARHEFFCRGREGFLEKAIGWTDRLSLLSGQDMEPGAQSERRLREHQPRGIRHGFTEFPSLRVASGDSRSHPESLGGPTQELPSRGEQPVKTRDVT